MNEHIFQCLFLNFSLLLAICSLAWLDFFSRLKQKNPYNFVIRIRSTVAVHSLSSQAWKGTVLHLNNNSSSATLKEEKKISKKSTKLNKNITKQQQQHQNRNLVITSLFHSFSPAFYTQFTSCLKRKLRWIKAYSIGEGEGETDCKNRERWA